MHLLLSKIRQPGVAVEPTNYGGRGNWLVRRVAGATAGKEMIVWGSALVARLD